MVLKRKKKLSICSSNFERITSQSLHSHAVGRGDKSEANLVFGRVLKKIEGEKSSVLERRESSVLENEVINVRDFN